MYRLINEWHDTNAMNYNFEIQYIQNKLENWSIQSINWKIILTLGNISKSMPRVQIYGLSAAIFQIYEYIFKYICKYACEYFNCPQISMNARIYCKYHAKFSDFRQYPKNILNVLNHNNNEFFKYCANSNSSLHTFRECPSLLRMYEFISIILRIFKFVNRKFPLDTNK